MKKIKPYLPLVLYSLLYAGLITLGSSVFRYQAAVLQMESALYDVFQTYQAVDDIDELQSLPENEKRVFEDLCFINLDVSFFNLETDRVRRDSLAVLLQILSAHADAKVIFLDYLFDSKSSNPKKDSLLIKSIEHLSSNNQRLILPFGLPPDRNRKDGIANILEDSILLIDHPYKGYLDYQNTIGNTEAHKLIRYAGIGRDEASHQSAILTMVRALQENETSLSIKEFPPIMEINYILRNRLIDTSKFEAIQPTQGRNIILSPNLVPKNKVIFIGLFEDYSSKYGLPIDQFRTPISCCINGIYLIINSYLNIVLGNYLRYPNWGQVFLINLFLAVLGGLYFHNKLRLHKALGWRFREIIGSLMVLVILSFGFYQYAHIKLPLVMISVFWVMMPYLYIIFISLITINQPSSTFDRGTS